MRKLVDTDHGELTAVLEALLAEDISITVREVARRHSALKHASAFTRNEVRMNLIERTQQRQRDARNVRAEPQAKRSTSMAVALAARNGEVAELGQQVQALVASHAGCIRAVLHHGGMPALERFWSDYEAIGERVKALGAGPTGGKVVDISRRS